MSKSLIIAVIVAALLAIGGFVWYFTMPPATNPPVTGNDNQNTSQNLPPMPPSSGRGQQVTIKSGAFLPAQLIAKAGQEVKWVNEDTANHIITGADFRSPILNPGDTYSHKFEQPGGFDYYCSLHPEMKARIIVE